MNLSIGLSLGDPTGVGPELWVKILLDRPRTGDSGPQLRLYGDGGVLERAAAAGGRLAAWRALLADPMAGLMLLPITALTVDQARPGVPSRASGAAQIAYLEAAIADAASGAISGLCTAPIHKASAHDAGLAFPGHTELLGARLGREPTADHPPVMMLAGPSLRVALATTHLPLSAVPQALTVDGLSTILVTTARALHDDFAIAAPKLWVAGLNPHAGESGHFGDEESRLIAPAIAAARLALRDLDGLTIDGPLVPDALFRTAVHAPPAERPDAVVAMYHDQGLIPLKLVDFEEAVNVTLGLRTIRTSPDHGVAHDIAGRWLARPTSQAAALALCLELAARRARRHRAG